MAIFDTYKVVINQDLLGKRVQNRYFYRQTSGASLDWASMANAVQRDLVPVLQTLQTDDLVYDTIEVINLDNPADFGISIGVVGDTGLLLGAPAPSWDAWSFRLHRTTRNIRNGGKRIGGVDESTTSGNEPTVGMLAVLQAASNIFGIPILSFAGDEYSPQLVRLGVGDVILYQEAVGAASFNKYSSQTSRKP